MPAMMESGLLGGEAVRDVHYLLYLYGSVVDVGGVVADYVYVVKVVVAGEAFHHGGVGHDDKVVEVVAEFLLAVLQHADDGDGHVAAANGLSYRVFAVGEEVLGHRLPYDADFGERHHV